MAILVNMNEGFYRCKLNNKVFEFETMYGYNIKADLDILYNYDWNSDVFEYGTNILALMQDDKTRTVIYVSGAVNTYDRRTHTLLDYAFIKVDEVCKTLNDQFIQIGFKNNYEQVNALFMNVNGRYAYEVDDKTDDTLKIFKIKKKIDFQYHINAACAYASDKLKHASTMYDICVYNLNTMSLIDGGEYFEDISSTIPKIQKFGYKINSL